MVWITLPNELDEKHWVRYHKMPRMQACALIENTRLNFLSNLSTESQPHRTVRATNIAAIVGHKTNRDVESLQRFMECGMNIARVNLSSTHGSLDYHLETIKNIRQAAKNYSKKLGVPFPVAIGTDTIGCEISTGSLEGGDNAEVELITGNLVKVTTDPAYKSKCSVQVIYIDYEEIFSTITVGRAIFIDDGVIQLQVMAISGAFMTCKVVMGGILGNHKTINLPGTMVRRPAMSDVDKYNMKFAVKNKLDFLFCAFIKDKQAVLEIKKELGESGKHIKIISKIQDCLGFQNLEEIISVSDGIVCARGDLYLEVTYPKLFIAQKYITAKCNRAGCPLIVGREFMESMLLSIRPTRCEIADIANAVIDGVDCIMMTRETIHGHPGDLITQYVSQICKEAEAIDWESSVSEKFNDWTRSENNIENTISLTAVDASKKCRAAAIFVITDTGYLAQLTSKYRPRCPIMGITRNSRVSRQMHLYRSVIPFLITEPKKQSMQADIDAQVTAAIQFGKDRLFISANDPIIIIIDDIKGGAGFKNTMCIQYIPEEIDFVDGVIYVK